MPLDPRARRLLSMVAATGSEERERPSVEHRRQSLAKLMQFARNDVGVVTTQDAHLFGPAGPLRYRLYTPTDEAVETDARRSGFVYFHGGGLVAGSIETHDRLAAALAAASKCRLLSIEYRLAPEHTFPAAFDDAVAAVQFAVDHANALGLDRDRIVVGGDSAGATLAAAVCRYFGSTASFRIATQCLICPVLDFSRAWPSRELFGNGYLVDAAIWQADLADCLPEGTDLRDPRISPLCGADFSNLPPAVIHTAEFDPMRDEGNAYAARLKQAGVPVAHVCHDGMVHNFHALGALLPQAKPALELIGRQIQSLLHARDLS
ncbi:Putative lipase/esterase [Bradyrhizobium sp. ORS 278]|uniref:alpha/beta hydrolase n=1 Tax=Bradyrhizobium sp. (strain ORS 278) TaxID=114615 RepID=UPI0001508D24|nr:alpha/beta hydrolase [Bradyrhizobium sp. ORS 278]CAL80501.1 Putative lipase/esterase [Bradyrhizobium sp. ORS 278]